VRRREFITLVGGAAVGWLLSTDAQPTRVHRVGVLTEAESDSTPVFNGLRKGLVDLGYIEGQTIVLEFRFARGIRDDLPGLAAELVRLPVDLIVTDGNSPARAALDATRTIPIVMGIAADTVAAGLVKSIARPGGNITGMTVGRIEQTAKRLELLKQAFPQVTVVTVLLNPRGLVGPNVNFPVAEDAAKKLGITLVPLAANNPDELRELQPSQLSRANGLMVLPNAIFWNYRATIVALVNAARVPAIYPERDYADSGGLIAFGPNIPDCFRRAAAYIDRILRGASPGDLPIDEASKFDFVVNLRTARALGLVPTAEFLARVDELIE